MNVLKEISEQWFLTEPAFYSLLCLQEMRENAAMPCPLRVGEGRVEYNPLLLAHKNFRETELLLRIEMIRLFLKHPYERRPEGCSGEVIARGSDCTIADGYCLLKEAGALKGPGAYHLPIGQCYEWYCKQIAADDDQRDKDEKNDQERHRDESRSALWHDDSLRQTQINELIERTTDWGTLPGDIVEQIQASTRAKIDSRMAFQGFKSNLFSANRVLTRMRPNRRTGFQQMGSRRRIEARLLLAVDCSASIDNETLGRFFATVNRLFRDGNVQLDVAQFDAKILSLVPMEHHWPTIEIHGRGGTSFQPVIDLLVEKQRVYDGLMILTDGEAPAPDVPPCHAPILWVCKDENALRQHQAWMQRSGRCCAL